MLQSASSMKLFPPAVGALADPPLFQLRTDTQPPGAGALAVAGAVGLYRAGAVGLYKAGGYVRLRTRAGDVIKLPLRLQHLVPLLIELHEVNPEAEARL
jgi:hypothetical protein